MYSTVRSLFKTLIFVTVLRSVVGNLNNDNERLELSMPSDIDETNEVYYICIDRVTYSDKTHPENSLYGIDHWPRSPDGRGTLLTRRISSVTVPILTTGSPLNLHPMNKGSQIVNTIAETKYGTVRYS